LRDKTNYTSPINVKQSSFFRSHKMNSTIFSRFLRALRRRKLKQNIWKMVWFSMSLYKFKSSRCSPCNQSTQRRRKVYRCWVSSSPIKRAEHETCKYNVNHHGWAHHQGENQIHFFQCRKDQWIHLTTDVGNFHTPLLVNGRNCCCEACQWLTRSCYQSNFEKPKWPLIGYLTVEAAFPLASITMPASKELGNHHTLNIADALLGEDWQRELVATKISLEHPLHHAQMAGAVRKLWGQWSNQICDRHSRRAPSTTSIHFFCKARRCGVRLFTCRPHFCHLQACSAKLAEWKVKGCKRCNLPACCRPSATQ